MRLFACCLLAAVWSAPLHAQDEAQGRPPDAPPSALPGLSLGSLSATRDRPLFAPNRRKPAPPPVAAVIPDQQQAVQPAPGPRTPQLELTGIIVSPSETIVLLRDSTTSESVAVHPGDTVGRWRVVLDSNDSVTLKDGDEEFKLEMFAAP